jgi:hypothetical protein
MKPHKVRFTVWLDPAALDAAKERSRQDGVSVSEALAQAATESLLRTRKDAEAQIVKAVERVFYLVHKTDRKRGFDLQLLKEMLGLMVLSFFNHTQAIPEASKKMALLEGKARFQRFLDLLAANLRGGKTILSDLPALPEEAPEEKRDPLTALNSANPSGGNEGGSLAKQTDDSKTAKPTVPSEAVDEHGREKAFSAPSDTSGSKPTVLKQPNSEPKSAEQDATETKKRWGLFG